MKRFRLGYKSQNETAQEQAILPSLRVLRSMIWDDIWGLWKTRWSQSKSERYIPTSLSTPLELKRLHHDLSKTESAILTQFRVGHTPLNWSRSRFRRSSTKLCSCGAVESSAHLVLDCPKYIDLRQNLQMDMMQKCQKIRTSMQWMLSYTPIVASTAKFLCAALERRNSSHWSFDLNFYSNITAALCQEVYFIRQNFYLVSWIFVKKTRVNFNSVISFFGQHALYKMNKSINQNQKKLFIYQGVVDIDI